MVFITSLIGAAALLSGFASGLPRPDSALGDEVAVSAPNGTPITDSAELAAQTASASASAQTTAAGGYGSGGNYGSSYGSGGGGYGSGKQESSPSVTYAPATSTSAWKSYSTSYGSGSANWGNQGYNDCVQQCVASYPGISTSYMPTATNSPPAGTGATHTVIVAPTQGVLRYVPFAVNASVGDTIKFMWGANNHTVTKSSELLPCNRSGDALFTSGSQNKDFVFTQVVNDTNPTFFYCATPTHCQKGMFGIINPPNAFQAPSSVASMMQPLAASNPNVAAYATYSTQQTSGNAGAAKWGANIDMGSMPEWSHEYIAENVMYTRTFLAANPEVLQDDGSVNLGTSGTTPLMVPQDLSVALAASTPAATIAMPSTAAPSDSPTPTPSGSSASLTNGASSIASSKVIGLVVGFATFLLM